MYPGQKIFPDSPMLAVEKRWLIGKKTQSGVVLVVYLAKNWHIQSRTNSKTAQHDAWSDVMTSLERWLIVQKNLLTFLPICICVCVCVCICVCICACICVCISDWLRRKTCWLLRPHQDQSRVAPPAKCWKPRSLSTVLPTPVVQIRHQQQIAAARSQTPSLQNFHSDPASHLHGRRHLRLDGELHQLDRLPHSRCTQCLRHSCSGAVQLPGRAAASDWGWEAARGSTRGEERRRGAHRTCSAAAVQTALGALVHVAGVLLSCRTNCFSQLLLLEESRNRFICPTLYSAAPWIWFISLHQSRSHHVTTTVSCLAISPVLTCHVRNHSKFEYKCHQNQALILEKHFSNTPLFEVLALKVAPFLANLTLFSLAAAQKQELKIFQQLFPHCKPGSKTPFTFLPRFLEGRCKKCFHIVGRLCVRHPPHSHVNSPVLQRSRAPLNFYWSK